MTSHERAAAPPGGTPRGPEGPQLDELEAEYEILGELGRGGTAVVYRALERELGRDVAIKVVRSGHLDDAEAIARLVREAKMVALLRHPNIVTLFGTRHLSSGGIALIMQCVPGRTLKQAIREDGPLPVGTVMSVLREIGSALDHAHRRHGIVHRDVKPENIYLDGDHGHAMLADFGIARLGDGESTLTLVGMALGTPAYMSPEQVDGGALDGRSDLYSLGLVAYEMLTGRQPWEGNTLYGIIYKQKNEELPPLNELRPDLPGNLQRAIEGLLRKDRAQRWSDAAQFLAQLRPDTRPPPRPARLPGAAAQPLAVGEDSPTIRYRRDAVDPGASETESAAPASDEPTATVPPSTSGAESAPDEAGGLPAGVFEFGTTAPPAASSPAASGREAGPRRWRTAFRVALLLVAVTATATVAMIRGPYPLERALPAEPSSVDPGWSGAPLPATPAAAPASPERLVVLAGGGQRGAAGAPLPRQIEVRVDDAAGRPVAGAEVEFQVLAGEGAVSPDVAVTDSSGIALASWTLGHTGVNEVVSRVRGTPDAAATLLAFGAATGPGRIVIAAGDNQEAVRGAALPDEIGVRVEDEQGNPLDGVPVEFHVTAGGGSVNPAQAVAGNGVARTEWTLGAAAGAHTLVAEVPGTRLRATVNARARYRLAVAPLIVAGGTHTCRLAPSGETHCWGGNANGQLGTGASGRQSGAPAVLGAGPLARLAAGVSHTCGLDRDGAALCWGINDEGQLGTGDRDERLAPAPVRGVESFVAIVAGLSHTCALGEEGRAFCWGAGRYGQLGDGTGSARLAPAAVAGGLRFTTLSAGWSHTCGLTREQLAYCWGVNREGQIGDGTTADRATPTRVAGDLRFVSISAGATRTCGITPDGDAYCWGEPLGAVGLGSISAGPGRPARVDAPARFVSSVAGAAHACALTHTGEIYCWGRNNAGQLGNGGTEDSPTAVPVAGGILFTSLTATGSHTCGRSVNGEDYCWGYNMEGQLGDGSRTRRSQPVHVALSSP